MNANALTNAIATATLVVSALETGEHLSPAVKASIPTLIIHLKRLDPSGRLTTELIARLEVFA